MILRVKHQTASSCWAVRSPTGQTMDHGLLCLPLCAFLAVCVSGYEFESLFCDGLSFNCVMDAASVFQTYPLCTFQHVFTYAHVNSTSVLHVVCLLTQRLAPSLASVEEEEDGGG